jgi:hypothetical protein
MSDIARKWMRPESEGAPQFFWGDLYDFAFECMALAATAPLSDEPVAIYQSPVTFEKWADDYGFYDTATDVHQYARACAKDAWEMATRVANYPEKPGDLVQCEACKGWSVVESAPPANPSDKQEAVSIETLADELSTAYGHHLEDDETEAGHWWTFDRDALAAFADRLAAPRAQSAEHDALAKVLFALTERQKGNVIRSEDEYIDEARAVLKGDSK